MKMKISALFLSALIVLSGCQTIQNASNKAKIGTIGGGAGAAIGAIIGALAGKGKGAAIGAAIGGVVGGGAGVLIGNKMDKAKKEAEEKAAAEAKAKKEQEAAERKAAAAELEEARKVMVAAQKHYSELLEAFIGKYKSYHYTTNSIEDIPTLFNSFNLFNLL